MSGKKIGYIRTNLIAPDGETQLDGVQLDCVFTESASCKDAKREQREAMIQSAQKGDVIFVQSMDKLARNLVDLQKTIHFLMEKSVRIEFIREDVSFSTADRQETGHWFSALKHFAAFEQALLKERQREGIILAKQRGVYQGRKRSLSDEAVEALRARLSNGAPKSQVARDFGISRETLYQYLRQAEQKQDTQAMQEMQEAQKPSKQEGEPPNIEQKWVFPVLEF